MSRKDEIFVAKKLLISRNQFFSEIDQLISQIDSLVNLGPDDTTFAKWRNSVESLLNHALGEKSQQAYDFGWIDYRPATYLTDEDEYNWYGNRRRDEGKEYREGLQKAKIHLRTIRDEVEKYFPQGELCSVTTKVSTPIAMGRDVFVVHGHDTELLLKVKEFLRKLNLRPIVLREQPNQGKTIIEKFESFSNVGFAIALLTSDDKVVADEEDGSVEYRARQNVILELGYFMGKLGRSRVAVLCDKNVARPGDIDGMVYTATDSDTGWQFSIAKELKVSGYDIDLNLLI